MTENIVINFTPCSDGSSIASNKIAKAISSFGFDLIDNETKADIFLVNNKRANLVFVVNGLWGFCKFRPQVAKIISTARRVVWCGNDWAIQKIKPIKDRLDHINFCNHENFNNSKNFHYLNWNCLTYDHISATTGKRHCDKNDILYYGAFRDDRLSSFKKWFGGSLPYNLTILTASPKSAEQFKQISSDATILKGNKFDPMTDSGSWSLGLYIEDDHSHSNFHSPANRFYEMMSSRLPIVFCATTNKTMSKAGFDVSDWIVTKKDDVLNFINNREQILNDQIKYFCHKDHKQDLLIKLKSKINLVY